MRSENLADVFGKVVKELIDDNGEVAIKDIIDDILKEYDPFYAVSRDELIRKAIYPQIVTLLNKNDFYSIGKGTYISLDYADIETLETLIDRFNEQIKRRKAKVSSLEKRKAEITGQMTIVFDGIQFAGYQEIAQ